VELRWPTVQTKHSDTMNNIPFQLPLPETPFYPPGMQHGLTMTPMSQTTVTGPMQPPYPLPSPNGLRDTWSHCFSFLFSHLSDTWALKALKHGENEPPGHGWSLFRDSAKVRFCCQNCGQGWTSMKGRATFWYRFDPSPCDGVSPSGLIAFKLYGQSCLRCGDHNIFETPMWYPEEVDKVTRNLYNRIGQTYYGWPCPEIQKDRRPGRPRTPHKPKLCQACSEGVCFTRRNTNKFTQPQQQQFQLTL